jgi:hypothetical protein
LCRNDLGSLNNRFALKLAVYLEDKDERGPDSLADYNIAKTLCNRCPHRQECAEWGIKNEAHGMWGGLTPKERAHLRQRRGILLDLT